MRTNPVVIVGLGFLVGAVPSLLLRLLSVSIGIGGAVSPATFSVSRLLGFLFFSVAIAIIVSSFVQAAMTRATVSASEGRSATMAECLTVAMRVFVPLVAMALLAGIGVMLGMFLLVVPGIILFLMWSVASPALVIERGGIIASLRRSAELTKGSKWKILGIFLLVMVAFWLLSVLVGAIGLTAYQPGSAVGLTVANLIGSIFLGTVLNTATGTLWPSLYVELRQAKEGTSIENLEQVFA